MEYTDSEIVLALRSSNELVFEALFRFYYQRLCNYANTLLKDADESEEAVQQFFAGLWERRERFSVTLSVKSYLYKSVHNACLNKIKQNQMKQAHHERESKLETVSKSSTEQALVMKELEQQIALAIESLPEQCRLIFKLSRFEELKYAEIAGQLNLSVKTVENQMGKALRVMREKLNAYLPTLLTLLLLTHS